MRRLLSIAIVLFAVSAICAQPNPDGAAIMKQSQAAAKRFHSLQFNSRTDMEMGPAMKTTTEGSTVLSNPGKMRSEMKTMGITMLMVSDGETSWAYNSTAKQYIKRNAALSPVAMLSAMGVPNVPDPSKIKTHEKVTGEETITVDGQKHDCWIVESAIDEFPMPGAAGAKVSDAVMKFWIDKKLLIDLKDVISMKMAAPQLPEPMQIKMNIAKRDVKIDEPVDEALFHFTPPADATEVETLMGASLGKVEMAGKPAAPFTVKDLDGKTYSLDALQGKPVLLDFWATWCGPCRKSMPVVEKLYKEFSSQGLVVLAVNSGEDRATVADFLKKSPMPYPAVLTGESGIMEGYQVSAFPTFILIGADGKIAANEVGFSSEEKLRAMMNKAGLKPPARQ